MQQIPIVPRSPSTFARLLLARSCGRPGAAAALATSRCSNAALQTRWVSTEGLHYRDQAEPTHHQHQAQAQLKEESLPKLAKLPGDDSSLKHQDWVLFHPVYDQDEVRSVKVVHHTYTKTSDKIARGMVCMARKTFDLVTGYKQGDMDKNLQGKEHWSLEELRARKLVMGPDQWLQRIIFLESIAGVPGMAAGVLRHLKSLRVVRRDGGWIRTLLADAENERMHLLTFLKVKKPSLLMRALLLGAQGVFFNAFFLSYLFWPSACHRFVGALEEEAVHTYSVLIKELEAGRLPEWRDKSAPQIAIDYWRMPEDANMLDLIYNVRADESQHRFVNHTLANLDQVKDSNPFAIREPTAEVKGTQSGFTREEAQAWTAQTEQEAKAALAEHIQRERDSLVRSY